MKYGEATAYECIRRGGPPKDGLEIEKGQFINERLVYFDGRNKDRAPRMHDVYWEDLPLETWFLEAKEKMGGRDYIFPFGISESSMERCRDKRRARKKYFFSL